MSGGLMDAILHAGAAPWIVGVGAAAVAVALRGLAAYRARSDRYRLADSNVLESVSRSPSHAGVMIRFLLLALGAGSLAAVLTGSGGEPIESEAGAGLHEIVLVLDASNSMLAEDVGSSRVSLQRAVARRLVAQIDARFGVVFFAGGGYVLSPLTEDRDATLMFTETVDPSVVGRGGTSLPAGLSQGLAVLSGGQTDLPKALVLLSDGEATTGDAELEAVLGRSRIPTDPDPHGRVRYGRGRPNTDADRSCCGADRIRHADCFAARPGRGRPDVAAGFGRTAGCEPLGRVLPAPGGGCDGGGSTCRPTMRAWTRFSSDFQGSAPRVARE